MSTGIPWSAPREPRILRSSSSASAIESASGFSSMTLFRVGPLRSISSIRLRYFSVSERAVSLPLVIRSCKSAMVASSSSKTSVAVDSVVVTVVVVATVVTTLSGAFGRVAHPSKAQSASRKRKKRPSVGALNLLGIMGITERKSFRRGCWSSWLCRRSWCRFGCSRVKFRKHRRWILACFVCATSTAQSHKSFANHDISWFCRKSLARDRASDKRVIFLLRCNYGRIDVGEVLRRIFLELLHTAWAAESDHVIQHNNFLQLVCIGRTCCRQFIIGHHDAVRQWITSALLCNDRGVDRREKLRWICLERFDAITTAKSNLSSVIQGVCFVFHNKDHSILGEWLARNWACRKRIWGSLRSWRNL